MKLNIALILMLYMHSNVIAQSTTIHNAVTASLQNTIIRCITGDPSNKAIMYVGLKGKEAGSGLLKKSADYGVTWLDLNGGSALTPEDTDVQAFVAAPGAPQTLFAGTWKNGLFRSDDGGSSWQSVTSCPTNDVRDLAIHPSEPRTIIAATGNLGVIKSIDDGKTWLVNDSAALHNNFAFAWSVTLDPQHKDVVYAQTFQGCYISKDAGTSWRLLFKPAEEMCWDLAVSGADTRQLWLAACNPKKGEGKIYHSADGGAHWTPADGLPEGFV